MQFARTCNFVLGIADQARVNCLLGFEYRINALGRNDRLPLESEDERRILPVEYHHIDLVAEIPLAIDDVRLREALAAAGLRLDDRYLTDNGGWVLARPVASMGAGGS